MKILFNFKELKLKILREFDTQENFAKAMGMSAASLNHRLNNLVDWSPTDIVTALNLLHIPKSEVADYFFVEK